jgi:hypothetical protein
MQSKSIGIVLNAVVKQIVFWNIFLLHRALFLLATLARIERRATHKQKSTSFDVCVATGKEKTFGGSSHFVYTTGSHTSKRVTLSWKIERRKNESMSSLSQSLDIICSLVVLLFCKKHFYYCKRNLIKTFISKGCLLDGCRASKSNFRSNSW